MSSGHLYAGVQHRAKAQWGLSVAGRAVLPKNQLPQRLSALQHVGFVKQHLRDSLQWRKSTVLVGLENGIGCGMWACEQVLGVEASPQLGQMGSSGDGTQALAS